MLVAVAFTRMVHNKLRATSRNKVQLQPFLYAPSQGCYDAVDFSHL